MEKLNIKTIDKILFSELGNPPYIIKGGGLEKENSYEILRIESKPKINIISLYGRFKNPPTKKYYDIPFTKKPSFKFNLHIDTVNEDESTLYSFLNMVYFYLDLTDF